MVELLAYICSWKGQDWMGVRLGYNNPHSQLFLYNGWFNAMPAHRGQHCNRIKRGGSVQLLYTFTWQFHIQVRHLMLSILSLQYCLCGLWEGSLTTVVGFRLALDWVFKGTLVRRAAYIFCGTVRVKQVDCIRAARVSSEIWWWSATCVGGCTFKKNGSVSGGRLETLNFV